MEPIISKLQEGVKYPRFERDATTIINDLVEHITKERGVYSSSIEPNPNEHKVWFNTNNNTLNIYENGKWNTISGQGGGTISGGIITGATIDGGYLTGTINASGATIDGGNIHGATLGGINVTSGSISYANISNSTISGATISGGTITGTINATNATINNATIYDATINGANIGAGNSLLYAGSNVLVTYTGNVAHPILMPSGGCIGNNNASLILCGVTLTGGDFTKLKNLQ